MPALVIVHNIKEGSGAWRIFEVPSGTYTVCVRFRTTCRPLGGRRKISHYAFYEWIQLRYPLLPEASAFRRLKWSFGRVVVLNAFLGSISHRS